MVYRVFKIVALLFVVFSFSSCLWLLDIFSEDVSSDDTNIVSFKMKNLTGEQLILKSKINLNCRDCYSQEERLHIMTIEADSNNIIRLVAVGKDFSIDFFDVLGYHKYYYDTVFIYSRDNVLLRTWAEQDKDKEGVQFFNQNSWSKYTWTKDDSYHIYTDYTFDLKPEDIQILEKDRMNITNH